MGCDLSQMETSMTYLPGPGDEATWGACYGHPHDPRTPTFDDDFDWPEDDEDAKYEEPEE
jgi:hypothetical protein